MTEYFFLSSSVRLLENTQKELNKTGIEEEDISESPLVPR